MTDALSGVAPLGTAGPVTEGLHGRQLAAESPQQAAKAFEEMLVSQLFKAARKSMPLQNKDFGHSMFQEMFDEQLAAHIADQGLGLSDTILHDFVPHVAKGPTNPVDGHAVDIRRQSPPSQRGGER